MPVILVVDDSETDRALIRSFLKQESLDWIVNFAESAEQAIVMLDELAIDLVITDMMMPGMSGLELLSHIRSQPHPQHMPVVLVSGEGSEGIAVEAIRQGAASYVPKSELSKRLIMTVKQVLASYKSEQTHSAIYEELEDVRYRMRLANDPALIPPLVGLLQQMAANMKLLESESRTRFGVALDEALINAMYHGNLELPTSELADTKVTLRNGLRVETVDARASTAPFADRRVSVQALLTPERIEVTIVDDGAGFDRSSVDPSGRGLKLIESISDEVAFNDAGNEIRLVKFRDEPIPNDSDVMDMSLTQRG